MGEGNILGEMSVLENRHRSATAIALTEVKVLVFDRQSFTTIIEKQIPMALKVLSLLASRLYELKRNIMLLKLKDIQTKVMDVFLMEYEKQELENISNTKSFRFYLSIQDIAHWSCESVDDIKDTIRNFEQRSKLKYIKEKNEFEIGLQEINNFTRIVQAARKRSK